MDTNEYIKLGTCLKVHGIKGEFSFHLFNADKSILKKKNNILITPLPGSTLPKAQEFTISSIRFGNKAICSLDGVDTRNLAEEMIPFEFSLNRTDFPLPESDEYYLSDLVGCDVFSEASGLKVGRVERFYDSGVQDIVVIKMPNDTLELPLVDQFFKEIDTQKRRITIVVPEFI